MVSFRPLSRVGLVIHCFVTSLTNQLLSGVILQVSRNYCIYGIVINYPWLRARKVFAANHEILTGWWGDPKKNGFWNKPTKNCVVGFFFIPFIYTKNRGPKKVVTHLVCKPWFYTRPIPGNPHPAHHLDDAAEARRNARTWGPTFFCPRCQLCPETIFRLPHGQSTWLSVPQKVGSYRAYIWLFCAIYLNTLGFFPLNLEIWFWFHEN